MISCDGKGARALTNISRVFVVIHNIFVITAPSPNDGLLHGMVYRSAGSHKTTNLAHSCLHDLVLMVRNHWFHVPIYG